MSSCRVGHPARLHPHLMQLFSFIDMALFGKKPAASNSPDSPAGASAPTVTAPKPDKKSRGFGRKKDTAPGAEPSAPGAVEDFSDFSAEALAGEATNGAANGQATAIKKSKPKARSVKSGVVVGLNIGNDSIKAVELRARGGEIAVTAMGMVPTPPDAIANGVVMSVSALSGALRELWKGSKIKTSDVVSSVAGTGALVVRVIEVPRMTDADLAANMKVDVDRYIPFPPSEVILDFKALRDLPGDPDSPNMDVLLAAAQREIIDLHIKVLQDARLSPKAIDVEPLAATRSLQGAPRAGVADVNYDDVSALINIGATGTEISVLRGDVLVFTRTVPIGGAAMTQAISETLGLTLEAAEAAKRERGGALAPSSYQNVPDPNAYGAAPAYDPTAFDANASSPAASDDWSQLGSFDATPAAASSVTLAPTGDAATAPDAATAAPATEDPFDMDFFNQGPQAEPQERHGQQQSDDAEKKDEAPFDFSSFGFAGDDAPATSSVEAPAPAAPTEVPVPAAPTQTPATDAALDLPTAVEANDAALSSGADDIFSLSTPTTTSATTTDAAPAADFSGFSFSFDEPETPGISAAPITGVKPSTPTFSAAEAALPTAAEAFEDAQPPAATPAAAAFSPTEGTVAPTLTPFDNALPAPTATSDVAPNSSQTISFTTLPSDDMTVAPQAEEQAAPAQDVPDFAPAAESSTTFSPATSESAFDLTSFETPAAPATNFAAPVTGAAANTADFDLDAMFSGGDTLPASTAAAGDFGAGLPASAGGFDAGASEFGGASFDDLSGFGAGLTADAGVGGIDEAALHAAMAPLLAELSNEIRRSLEFHASRYPDAVVRHITLVGGGARLKYLNGFLEQTLGIPVAIGNPLQSLVLRAPQWEAQAAIEAAPAYAVAIGLALRELV